MVDIIEMLELKGQYMVNPAHSKTRVIGQVSAGTTYIDVDSTVGFPTSGEYMFPIQMELLELFHILLEIQLNSLIVRI